MLAANIVIFLKSRSRLHGSTIFKVCGASELNFFWSEIPSKIDLTVGRRFFKRLKSFFCSSGALWRAFGAPGASPEASSGPQECPRSALRATKSAPTAPRRIPRGAGSPQIWKTDTFGLVRGGTIWYDLVRFYGYT